MIGRLLRLTLFSLAIASLLLLVLSSDRPLSIQCGSVASLPMAALACAEGQFRVETVSIVPPPPLTFHYNSHLGFGYFTMTAAEVDVEETGLNGYNSGRSGGWMLWFPPDHVFTRPPGPALFTLSNVRFTRCYVPLWVLPVLLVAYPALHRLIRAARRHRLIARGSCLGCGYDLRGSISGICPECGVGEEDHGLSTSKAE